MHIFKESCIFFYQNQPENVTNFNVFFESCVKSTVHQIRKKVDLLHK